MNKKAVFVIAQNSFHDTELLAPKAVLDQRKITTKIASMKNAPAHGKLGAIINPDLTLDEIKVTDFDAIIFVGGKGSVEYFENDQALNLVKDFQKAGKILGAICLAPSILANAGALIGKIVTATSSQEENLRNKGAEYTGMPSEVDGKVVTAKGPDAAKDFGEKLAYLLEE